VYHGYTEFYLAGKWVKATPAFNVELCEKHHVAALDFNGREDSIFHEYSPDKKQFMEYLEYNGVYADIPVEDIVATWKTAYGTERVQKWIDDFEKARLASFDQGS
jgi:transglutaminase-like putative cysteine protease